MDRLACINLPSFPLQIALRRFEPNCEAPVVVIPEDRPTSRIQHLNRQARAQGLRIGMRYGEALSFASGLRAVTVSAQDLAEARREVLTLLSRWSPQIEHCPYDPGSFWLNASGLSTLFGSEVLWGSSLRESMAQKRFKVIVVIGTTRGGTYILARHRRRSTVVASLPAEQRSTQSAPLSILPLLPRHRRLLERLGITTLAALTTIPPQELARRFGPELARDLHRLSSFTTVPIQAWEPPFQLVRVRRFESPVSDHTTLMALLEQPLDEGLAFLVQRGWLLAELRLVFVLESSDLTTEVLRPANPTAHRKTLLRLLDLRISQSAFPSGVVEVALAFLTVGLPAGSGNLFAPPVNRDLRRGAEAIALIRAQWGNAAAVRAVPVDSHIPEQSFRWESVEQLRPPTPRSAAPPLLTAVRRMALDGRQMSQNPAGERLGGPYRLHVVSGGESTDKEYWFLKTNRHEVVWASWNRLTGQPSWEGVVD